MDTYESPVLTATTTPQLCIPAPACPRHHPVPACPPPTSAQMVRLHITKPASYASLPQPAPVITHTHTDRVASGGSITFHHRPARATPQTLTQPAFSHAAHSHQHRTISPAVSSPAAVPYRLLVFRPGLSATLRGTRIESPPPHRLLPWHGQLPLAFLHRPPRQRARAARHLRPFRQCPGAPTTTRRCPWDDITS